MGYSWRWNWCDCEESNLSSTKYYLNSFGIHSQSHIWRYVLNCQTLHWWNISSVSLNHKEAAGCCSQKASYRNHWSAYLHPIYTKDIPLRNMMLTLETDVFDVIVSYLMDIGLELDDMELAWSNAFLKAFQQLSDFYQLSGGRDIQGCSLYMSETAVEFHYLLGTIQLGFMQALEYFNIPISTDNNNAALLLVMHSISWKFLVLLWWLSHLSMLQEHVSQCHTW